MSSDDDGTKKIGQDAKKRRIQRACDVCRRKKVRCDGIQKAGNQCTNCIDYGVECTYVEAAKRRGPPKSYVDKLENRVERLQALLTTISPDALKILDSTSDIPSNTTFSSASSLPPLAPPPQAPQSSSSVRFIRHLGSKTTPPPASEDDEAGDYLVDQIERLRIHPNGDRFFGKSSVVTLMRAAMKLKQDYLGLEGRGELLEHNREDRGQASLFSESREPSNFFWPTHPLLSADVSHPSRQPPIPSLKYDFPPSDLIVTLADLYFTHMNLYLPLLHRPTFERAIAQGLHLTDSSFASTLLLVCAVAARYSDDPRVLDNSESKEKGGQADRVGDPGTSTTQDSLPLNTHSYGWKWFKQARIFQTSHICPPSLYDLQCYALTSQFLQASSVPQACWTVAGIGVRVAQDVGAHRRKARGTLTVEDELWKRAFWVLVCMDRLFASSTGRPCSIRDEDFDVDMPVECDDEYWEHPDPELRWRQPTIDKTPSVVTYFNVYIRLNQILAFLLRTVYAINKSKILLGLMGQSWEESVVSELESALNNWVDNLPDHLRWDPTRTNVTFFNQSASLYSAYYHIKILVHRPFIPSPRKPDGALSFPSLAICTNAARACSHVVDVQRRRTKVAIPPVQTAAFSSGVILLLSIWGGKRSGLITDFNKEMGDVRKCMDVLKASESRWYHAGRLHDILCELASVGDLPLPQRLSNSPPGANQKREREPEPEPASKEGEAKGRNEIPAPVAGSHRGSLHETPNPILVDHTPRVIAGRTSRRQPIPSHTHGNVSDGSEIAGGMNPPIPNYPVLAQQHQQQQQRQELYAPSEYEYEFNPRPMYHLHRHYVHQNQAQTQAVVPVPVSVPPPQQPLPPQPLIPLSQPQHYHQPALERTTNPDPQYWREEPIARTSADQSLSHGLRSNTARSQHRPIPSHVRTVPQQPRMLPQLSSNTLTPIDQSSSSFEQVYYGHNTHGLGSVPSFSLQSGGVAQGYDHHPHPSYTYDVMHGAHDHGLSVGDVGMGISAGGTINSGTRVVGGGGGEHHHMGVGVAGAITEGGISHGHDGSYPMWSSAPMSFELNEWGDYLSNMNNQPSS